MGLTGIGIGIGIGIGLVLGGPARVHEQVPEPEAPSVQPASPTDASASSVTWEGACADAGRFQARVNELLGEDEAREFSARARGALQGDAVSVEVSVIGPRGEERREFSAPDCGTAVEAAALVVAVGVDALSVAGSEGVGKVFDGAPGPEPDPGPGPGPVPVPGPGPVPDPVPVPVPVPVPGSGDGDERLVQPFAILEPGITVGIVPGVGGVLRLGVGLRWRWLVAELLAARHFPKSAALLDARVEVGMWNGVVRVRGEPSVQRWRFPISLGLALGDMTGSGRGLAGARTAHGLYGAVQVGAGVAWSPVRWISVGVAPALSLAFARPQFGGETPGGDRIVAYQPPVAGFLGLAAVEVRF